MNSATQDLKTTILQFSQHIHQYQMDFINAELADYQVAAKHQKSPRDAAQSQKSQTDLVGNQYTRLINYWTGLTQVILQGSNQMLMAVSKCGVDTANQLRDQTGIPAMPDYMQSAMNAGTGYVKAGLDASQRFAEDNAHAVLDATAEHGIDGTGKHSKSGAQAKHNPRHADGAAA